MQGNKIEAAKEVLRRTAGKLHPNDTFALVVFHEAHNVVIPHGPCTLARRAEADQAIGTLDADHNTELAPPLRTALATPKVADVPKTIVFSTDGESTVRREMDEKALVECAEMARANRTRLVVIGVGVDYNFTLLERVVSIAPNSELFHVDDPREAEEIVRQLLTELRSRKLYDLIVTGKMAKGVQIRSVTAFSPFQRDVTRQNDEHFVVESGALTSYRGQQLLLELFIADPAIGERELCTLTFQGRQGAFDSGTPFEEHETLKLHFTADLAAASSPTHREVRAAIIRAEAYRKMRAQDFKAAAQLYESIGDTKMAVAAWTAHGLKHSNRHDRECSSRGATSTGARTQTMRWGDLSNAGRSS